MTEGQENRPRRAASDDDRSTPSTDAASPTGGRRAVDADASSAAPTTSGGSPSSPDGDVDAAAKARRGLLPEPVLQADQRPARQVRVQRSSSSPTTDEARNAETVMLPKVTDDSPAPDSTRPAAGTAVAGSAAAAGAGAGAGKEQAAAATSHDPDATNVIPVVKEPLAKPEPAASSGAAATTGDAEAATAPGVAAAAQPNPWARPGSASASAASPGTAQQPKVAAAQAAKNPAADANEPQPPKVRRSRSAGWAPADGADRTRRRRVIALSVATAAVLLSVISLVTFAALGPQRGVVAGEPAQTVEPTPPAVVNADSLMTAEEATKIDDSRDWTVRDTQPGRGSYEPVCIGSDPNLPAPELSHWRSLEATGDDSTAALHIADAYSTAEQAEEVYDNYLAALGDCSRGGTFWLRNGIEISGLGDEAAGAVATYQSTEDDEQHSVVVSRTGRIVEVVDATRTKDTLDSQNIVDALAPAVNRQCNIAGGLCASGKLEASDTAPAQPADPQGFLVGADIPRISKGVGQWGEGAISDSVDLRTSQCVGQDLADAGGSDAEGQQMTMLLTDDTALPDNFGLDEVVISLKDANAANELRDNIVESLEGCADARLTAKADKVGDDLKFDVGDDEAVGAAYTAEDKVDESQATNFRLGLVTVDNKIVFVQATNVTDDFNFTDDQWRAVVTRAAERSV
ncbi:hypothetical protein ACF3NT_09115 [Naumannella halotolerans]|uniref:hypothetical protein n=1 Tax=Naumannella halotolerans TaxID=993414 RepID=UPI00370D67EA